MTEVTVKYKNDRIVSLSADGHSGYGKHGEDIVCAAASVLMQTAVNSLHVVAGIDYLIFESEESTAYMYIELPNEMNETQTAKAEIILKTVLTGLQGIAEVYPDNMRLYDEGGANYND